MAVLVPTNQPYWRYIFFHVSTIGNEFPIIELELGLLVLSGGEHHHVRRYLSWYSVRCANKGSCSLELSNRLAYRTLLDLGIGFYRLLLYYSSVYEHEDPLSLPSGQRRLKHTPKQPRSSCCLHGCMIHQLAEKHSQTWTSKVGRLIEYYLIK